MAATWCNNTIFRNRHQVSRLATTRQMSGAVQTRYKHETEEQVQCNANPWSMASDNTNLTVFDNDNSKINYFLPGPSQGADRGQVQSYHSINKRNLKMFLQGQVVLMAYL